MAILLFFVLHWYTSLFTQTFFNHRYAAHSAFTMTRFWEKIFYLFSFIAQGSSYMSPRAYAIMHRMHHAYTDSKDDPHSPKFSKNLSDMMWRTNKIYLAIFRHDYKVEERFLKNVPDWPAIDRIGLSWSSTVIWTMIYISYYMYFSAQPWMYILIPIHIAMGPIHGTIINWVAHKYGTRNFEQANTSKNLLPVDLIMMGESYHNNHHKHPSEVNFGKKWFEFDLTYPIILLFNWLHIIRIKNIRKRSVPS